MGRKHHKKLVIIKSKRITFSKKKRQQIFIRCNYECQLCQKDLRHLPKERVIDHKEPLSKFGSNKDYNLWLLCLECDRKKGSEILPIVIQDRMEQLKQKYPYLNKNKHGS